MKNKMKMGLLIFFSVVVLVILGCILFKYLVTNRVMDRGGMERSTSQSEENMTAVAENESGKKSERLQETTSVEAERSKDGSTGTISDLQTPAIGTYRSTVTVSTIEECLSSIANDTRIILKAGTYDLSETKQYDNRNPYLRADVWGDICDYTIVGVSNLSIEAQEGAEVSVVTQHAGAPVLRLEYCSNINLDGLVCGHDVNPGSCTGSVIAAYRTNTLAVNNCWLYGCGTYGIDADQCTGLSADNTEIYDCSEGILLLNDTWIANFSGCRFYQNEGFNMFRMIDSYDITFTNTEIYENQIGLEHEPLIDVENSENVVFKECEFRDNMVEPSAEEYPDVFFENCNVVDSDGGTE